MLKKIGLGMVLWGQISIASRADIQIPQQTLENRLSTPEGVLKNLSSQETCPIAKISDYKIALYAIYYPSNADEKAKPKSIKICDVNGSTKVVDRIRNPNCRPRDEAKPTIVCEHILGGKKKMISFYVQSQRYLNEAFGLPEQSMGSRCVGTIVLTDPDRRFEGNGFGCSTIPEVAGLSQYFIDEASVWYESEVGESSPKIELRASAIFTDRVP